jgi:hypothetical protein
MKLSLKAAWILMLTGLLFFQTTYAFANDFGILYSNAKKLYDENKFSECTEECLKVRTYYEKQMIASGNFIMLANLYELNADCFDRMNNTDKSVNLLNNMLDTLHEKLPEEYVARIRLKMGHIYKNAGLYSKALSVYQDVENKYAMVFPTRFAKYARENLDIIVSKQVAVISGEIHEKGGGGFEDVTIKVFNGFEQSETKSGPDGRFSIPLFSSSPGTKLSLFAIREGYKPTVVVMGFDGRPEIQIKKIILETLCDKDTGVLTGVIFVPVSGGKLRPHHGISRFSRQAIKISKVTARQVTGGGKEVEDEITVSSDETGIYTAFLSSGSYVLNCGKKERFFKIEKGEITIINLSHGKIFVD